MADFQILPWSFTDTEATLVACNDAAKQRIYGGVSVKIRLSQIQQWYATLIGDGFKVEIL
jgi:hypothetical protein